MASPSRYPDPTASQTSNPYYGSMTVSSGSKTFVEFDGPLFSPVARFGHNEFNHREEEEIYGLMEEYSQAIGAQQGLYDQGLYEQMETGYSHDDTQSMTAGIHDNAVGLTVNMVPTEQTSAGPANVERIYAFRR